MKIEEVQNLEYIDENLNVMKNIYNICKATVKFVLENDKASGFFLKFERNDKEFHCIITCEHVINTEMIKEEREILVKYDNEHKELKIKLDSKERIIKEFRTSFLQLDVTIIEIIEKDNIEDMYFLSPNLNYDEFNELRGKEIQIPQFPKGRDLSIGNGKICDLLDNNYMFIHSADTKGGSSGSPIVLKGQETVIAIHKARLEHQQQIIPKKVGIFIGIIIEVMKEYKKEGERIEYYKNGKKKYEGKFSNDEYDDNNGTYYYENGEIYLGQFKDGKKHGSGCIIKDGKLIKRVEYENDNLIKELDDEEENNNENENNQINDEEKEEKNNSNNESINDDNEEDSEDENKAKNDNNNNNKKEDINNEKQNEIKNNNNNTNQNNKPNNFVDDFQKQSCYLFHDFANFIGLRCTRSNCGHKTESHTKIDNAYGYWKCKECPENDNICKFTGINFNFFNS